MTSYKKIKEMLIEHEGMKLKPYLCSAGKMTIGVGRNLDDRGITEREAVMLLWGDIKIVLDDLKRLFGGFADFSEARQMALVDMRFQLGAGGFRRFKKLIAAVRENDWTEAARQVEDSTYFKQVPNRAAWVRERIRAGE